jgi:hypothetical protein
MHLDANSEVSWLVGLGEPKVSRRVARRRGCASGFALQKVTV